MSVVASARPHLTPRGVLRGAAARAALEAGIARPFGPGGAFLALERDGSIAPAQPAPALERKPSWPRALPARAERGPLVMGVLNATPDSFSDGGRYLDPGAAAARGLAMVEEGASIVDVGGESTRPGAAAVSAEEERARVEPVVRALAAAGVAVSIDSRNARTMRAALDAGAVMINDVTALRHDPESLTLAARAGCAVCLMHSQGEPATMQAAPRYDRAFHDVYDHLEARVAAFGEAGGDPADLVLDPGVGFGKTLAHNLDLFDHFAGFAALGRPLLMGASRKSFIPGVARDQSAADARIGGSLAAALDAAGKGAAILRVHDVRETVQAATIAFAIG